MAPATAGGAIRTSGSAGDRGAAPGLLGALMARLAAVPSRRALFTETKTLAALRLPLHSSGRLAYRRPDRLDKITTWPQPEVLTVRAGRLRLTTDGATRRIDLAAQPVIAALVEAVLGTLAGDLAGLRRDYHVRASGDLAAWRLVLTPRGAALAGLLRQVAITGRAGWLLRLRTVQTNGDVTVMIMTPAA